MLLLIKNASSPVSEDLATIIIRGNLIADATGTLNKTSNYNGKSAWTDDGLAVDAIAVTGRTILHYDTLDNTWVLTKYASVGVSPIYKATKQTTEDSPVGLLDWIVVIGSGQPVVSDALSVGAFVGQRCRVGNAEPFSWYKWNGTSWESEAAGVTQDDVTSLLGVPSYSSLTAANAALSVGSPYFDTTLNKLQIATA
jgi:hypothetical protein